MFLCVIIFRISAQCTLYSIHYTFLNCINIQISAIFILPAFIFFLNLAVDFTYTILKHASVIIIIIISFKIKIKIKLFIYAGIYRSLVSYILV